ncbi:MAG TPA: hypothetical protein VEC06_16100 [Paucimonas sp.]|nr:hypothetical protein [Paucimonas sp.]
MFTKKFLESNFTPQNIVASRQKIKPETDAAPPEAEPPAEAAPEASIEGLLARHKGKLAVGAAAMLGIAAFYHWRESKLAKEDEEEYARLQRLKAALDVDGPKRE